ncbi:MAG: hypothetical protein M1828_000412 [Chrysothrix sp. TS-e1954]|nr:MAG: hypothetical protein M1828_000412 [Chrysothrix sp. TS-e1954]
MATTTTTTRTTTQNGTLKTTAPKPFPKMSPFKNDLGAQKDRHGAPRVVPMKVLCLGLSRTGTASLTQAIKRLGYVHCYHGYDPLLQNASDMKFWLEAKNEKCGKSTGRTFTREDFDQILGHCQAVTDFPCVDFAEELIKAYPEAKVVYTTREREGWYKHPPKSSVNKTLHYYTSHSAIPRVAALGKLFGTNMQYVQLYMKTFFEGYYGGDFAQHGRQTWDRHHELVHSLVPQDRILDFQVKEGWGPLCAFLGDPVPDVEFPRVNDAEEFKKGLKTSVAESGEIPGGWLILYAMIHPVRFLFRGGVLMVVLAALCWQVYGRFF